VGAPVFQHGGRQSTAAGSSADTTLSVLFGIYPRSLIRAVGYVSVMYGDRIKEFAQRIHTIHDVSYDTVY
jgi:hypothetical protein